MSGLTFTSLEEIEKIHSELRANVRKLRPIAYRKYQLLQLAYMIKDNADRIGKALTADLGRPPLENNFLEIAPAALDAKIAYDKVEEWTKPEKPAFSINFTFMRPVVRKEPKGVVLIISPFNYPLWLSIGPLAGAIAAGCPVVLKPSELSPATSALMAELISKYLDPDVVRVVNGAIPETTKILELQWDHILYTGGARVGKIVAAAAAKHLTPVTLELGGKSPVIIDPKCDVAMAARRILWGKTTNSGQTCVAPDYVLVPREFQETFIQALKDAAAKFWPDSAPPSKPGVFSRMITPQAFHRVKNLLDNTKGTVVIGGDTDEATKFISPTVVKNVTGDDSLMNEEIFGPILPIVPVKDVDEAIAFVNARDHPLALYVFSQDAKFKHKVFDNTQSGAAVANEIALHLGADGLPFGGVGSSGYGQHTGKFSFDMFTHLRSSMDSPSWIDFIIGFRFPPYTARNAKKAFEISFPSLPARPIGPPDTNSTGTNGRSKLKWFLLALALGCAAFFKARARLLQQ